ncbi:hypothetical protein TRP8649_01640 [Pelagimonas phthalicica]|uniref:Uncharacterized protein n=1 Tax=Pelagimonas phthalicica TaxID=1037362 RepID=A0A238JAU0_9RHOB|nr:hypothetical protein CLV87_0432 [Pelagimonas phthalicica]SMX27535.1 hypothetical protein TRP8649_01640 [Pelagimonas phthalicica]
MYSLETRLTSNPECFSNVYVPARNPSNVIPSEDTYSVDLCANSGAGLRILTLIRDASFCLSG